MAKIDTSMAEYIGYQLCIREGDYELPDGYQLPDELQLERVQVHRRGVYLGDRWYFQSQGRTGPDTVDLVSPDEVGDVTLAVCLAFARHHGYKATGELPPDVFLYRRS
jgi:hypothetical protein